jgi:hypothetical protein
MAPPATRSAISKASPDARRFFEFVLTSGIATVCPRVICVLFNQKALLFNRQELPFNQQEFG